jgi:hypothetical protein
MYRFMVQCFLKSALNYDYSDNYKIPYTFTITQNQNGATENKANPINWNLEPKKEVEINGGIMWYPVINLKQYHNSYLKLYYLFLLSCFSNL